MLRQPGHDNDTRIIALGFGDGGDLRPQPVDKLSARGLRKPWLEFIRWHLTRFDDAQDAVETPKVPSQGLWRGEQRDEIQFRFLGVGTVAVGAKRLDDGCRFRCRRGVRQQHERDEHL
ncbi:MAG: hypothetical protein KDA59_23665 [Planctomycetales bacterium]|nr:hypothetical protein [Planctomycetales bacterium]